MIITDVKVTGFKSFVDTISLSIESGLTGIVGPNGCGKSNILESLRWVMGATSAKALRGGEMDDVIFAGTDTRPARDIAEVIIKIDNSAKKAPEPFTNAPILEVSRKIKRGAGSTFRINGKEVRAKDVQLLFADASSGANSPALVRQGQVSELINAKPENRRRVLEEAAGIAGLQARRHEAQIKLNGTKANLERVDEILIHIEEQISSLKKQAQKANKYKGLAELIRGYELYLIYCKFQNLDNIIKNSEQEKSLIENKIAEFLSALNKANKELENIDTNLSPLKEEQAIAYALMRRIEGNIHDINRDISDAENNLIALENSFKKLESDINRENAFLEDCIVSINNFEQELKEIGTSELDTNAISELEQESNRIEGLIKNLTDEANAKISKKAQLEAEFFSLQRESAALNQEIIANKNAIINTDNILKSLTQNLISKASLEEKTKEISVLEAEIKELNLEIENKSKALINAENSENNIRQEQSEIQKSLNQISAELNGLKAINKDDNKSKNPLIKSLKIQSGYEKAIAAIFGDEINADINLKSDIFWANDISVINNDSLKFDFPIIDTLDKFTNAPEELVLKLKATAIVENEVFASVKTFKIGQTIVSLDGDLKRWDGYVKTKNAPLNSAVRLAQIRRISELETMLPSIELELSTVNAKLAAARSLTNQTRDNANNIRKNLPLKTSLVSKLNIELLSIQNQIFKQEEAINNQNEKAKNLAEIKEKLEKQKIDIEKRFAGNNQDEKDNLNLLIDEDNQNIANYRDQNFTIKSKVSLIKSEHEANIRAKNNLNNQILLWQKRRDETSKRLKDLASEKDIIIKKLEENKALPNALIEKKNIITRELPILEERKKKADSALIEAESSIKEIQFKIRTLEENYNKSREELSTINLTISNTKERIIEIDSELNISQNISVKELKNHTIQTIGEREFEKLNLELAQKNLSRAYQDREILGGVNLSADEELIEQTKRFETLENEKNEIAAAIIKLQKGIDEINNEGRERLITAFDKVNNHFSELFTALFGGGVAYLNLTENDDPLGGGLEVFACPPGKRIQSMTLMSGGEQALTATALIFAVFLSNPAPISVLDEIDAPLDDANVDRFCILLDEMRKKTNTRFICITHHPITMARMDRLFGVTMGEKGVSQVVAVDLKKAEKLLV